MIRELIDRSLRHWIDHPEWETLREEAYWAIKRELRLQGLVGVKRNRELCVVAQWAVLGYLTEPVRDIPGEWEEEVYETV